MQVGTHAGDRDAPRGRRTSWIVGLAIGAIALVVVVELAGGLEAAVRELAHADPMWIAIGVVCEATSFLFIALHLRRIVDRAEAVRLGGSYQLALVVYGLGAVTPAAPLEGVALGVQDLHRRGLSRRRALFALGFSEWFSNVALFTILAVDLVLATVFEDVRHDERVPFLLLALGIVAALVLAGLIVTNKRTITALNLMVHRARFWRATPSPAELEATVARLHADRDAVIGGRRKQVVLVLLSIGGWLFDLACLEAALLAMGVHANLDQLILAYGAGILATAVPFVPAGFGLTEIAMPAVLHHYGVPLAPALAGTLAYRGLGTVLPAAAGAVVALGMRRRPRGYRDLPSGA